MVLTYSKLKSSGGGRTRSHTSFTSILALLGGQAAVAGLGALGTVIQNRFVSPEVLGAYGGYAVLGSYLVFLQLGTMASLRREYPFLMGAGKDGEAREAAANVLGWVLLISVLTSVVFAILGTRSLILGERHSALAWLSQLVYVAMQFYSLYLGCTYRSTSEFAKWSLYNALGAFASLLLIPLVVAWGFIGICVRTAVPAVVIALLLHGRRPVRVKPRLSSSILLGMMKFGLPVDISGNLASVGVYATMNWIVLARFGPAMLGLLTTAKLIENILSQFAQSALQVYTPRIVFHYGKAGEPAECWKMLLKPLVSGLVVMSVVLFVGTILCRPLVMLVMPKYEGAIPIMKILIWASLLPILQLPQAILWAAKRTLLLTMGSVASFLSFLIVSFLAVALHWGLYAIIVAYMVSRLIHAAATFISLGIDMKMIRNHSRQENIWDAKGHA